MYHHWRATGFDVPHGRELTYATHTSMIVIYSTEMLETLIHDVNFDVRMSNLCTPLSL